MVKRKIIRIDEERCNGCGECIPNCAEGAIEIVDGKAKLIADKYCDGLGACLGHCPEDALKVIERDADQFDEEAVEELLARQKIQDNFTKVESRPQAAPPMQGCPGSRMRTLESSKENNSAGNKVKTETGDVEISIKSKLSHWPVQLALVPISGDLWNDADILISASCVSVAYPNYHLGLLKDKKVVIGCPKLDDIGAYARKLTEIFSVNNINSVTVAYMEVPCCGGIVRAVEQAVAQSGKDIPITKMQIGIRGDVLN